MNQLTDTLDTEAAAVTASTATACGAASPDPSITACLRTAGHRDVQVIAAHAHAGHQPINPGDPTSALRWVTWADPADAAPTPSAQTV